MPVALVLNPGSNSLKFELVEVATGQRIASQARKLASASIDDIGKGGALSVSKDGGQPDVTACPVPDMHAAVAAALDWLGKQSSLRPAMEGLAFAGVRVVHGGSLFPGPAIFSAEVRKGIESLEELTPLHNKSSLAALDVLEKRLPETRRMVTFDTSFHRTLPEVAWRYPIERGTADRNGVRKYGFHGLSHRYMLEQYAATVGKPTSEISVVTLHLESGCSACAVRNGESVDTTMGLTPLEGLMMGSRSGSIDPAIIPYLMHKEGEDVDAVMMLLNKESGMLGIAGGSLDTRVLAKREDDAAKLALGMFSYRVRLAVGAYLACLGNAEAVLFGGGIGEDSPWLRTEVCAGLTGWGLDLDLALNNRSTQGQVCVSQPGSRLGAWAMAVDEGLQIAHECALALQDSGESL